MSDMDKCKIYKDTQSSIKKICEKGLTVDRNVYINQLVLIKTDLAAKDENVRKAGLEMLDFLLGLGTTDVQTEVINILLDNAVNKFVQNCVLKLIRKKVRDAILEDKFDFSQILLPWKNHNVNKLTNVIEEVCLNDLSRDKCKEFFIFKVIPCMMDLSTNNEIRNILTDMAFMLSTIVPISDLSTKELEVFLKDVNIKYVKNIGDLRDQNYPNWHNMWIFLVRFCDKNIHHSMELTNRLLRVVEYAFRNSSVQQRLKGYDCWKELIDNASLDMKHMCSSKQIKLLVTPLKAKFSKQEVVICKRFDVFAYLLEKLQHKAVLCLTEFLEFCYGTIGDNKDASKVGQGKTVPQIWTRSTKVLVDIIGHSHGKSVPCLTTEDVIKLERPVINHTNISNYYKIIINSVGECCSLLKEVDIESKRETVIKCMWKSVFNLVIRATNGPRNKYFEVISDVLDNYIKLSRENPYFEDLLIMIFTVLMSNDKDSIYEVVQYILKQLLTVLFTTDNFPADVAENFKLVLSHAFSKILTVENKLKVIKEIMVCFTKVTPNDENIIYINKVWICAANELISDFTAQQIEEFPEFNGFFMWPALHLHHLDESAKKQTVLYWMKLYRKISLDSEEKKQNVMKELEKIFKNNPLLSSDVVSLLNVMSQFETKFTKEFVVKLMGVSSLILLLPNLKSEDEQKITALVMQYFEPSLECYKCEQNEEVIKNICICIEHILSFHKGYKLLDTLASFIRNSPDDLRAKFSHYLSNLLLDLYNKETDLNGYSAKELYKVIQVFNEESHNKSFSSPFVIPGGRSARIASLAKHSPRSSQAKSKKVEPSPTALRLFGKDLDTLSPLRVKGSQLNNSSPGKSKKSASTPKIKLKSSSVHDEKSSNFVPIDTEVKFQPEKLSKHQREVLRKRREDIPALYQDLSQSTSQDMFSSSSSSRSMDKVDKENSADNKKVIVEVIGHQFKEDTYQKEEYKVEKPFEEIPVSHIEEISAQTKEINSEIDLFASDKVNSVDPEETMYEEPAKEIDEKKEIEESKSKDNITEISSKKQETIQEKKGDSQNTRERKNSKSDSDDEKEKKRKMKIEMELQKLRMDIVGADEFLAASRRTRTRERPKKLEESVKSKIKEDQISRLALSEGKLENKAEKNRRKTIGTVKDAKPVNVEDSKLKDKSQSDASKTPRRRSVKPKPKQLDQNLMEDNKDLSYSTTSTVKESEKLETKESNIKATEYKEIGEKGQKRKHSSLDEDSEDIIESSQESRADVTPIFNSSKRRSSVRTSIEEKLDKSEDKTLVQQKTVTAEDFTSDTQRKAETDKSAITEDEVERMIDAIAEEEIKENYFIAETDIAINEIPVHVEEVGQEVEISDVEEIVEINVPGETFDEIAEAPGINTTQDTTITQESTQEMEDVSQNQIQDMETQDTETQSTTTQDTQTQEIPTQSTEDSRPPVLYFDLPKKPELTDSERIMCRMDTMSICSDPNNLNLKSQIGDNQSMEEVEVKVLEQLDEPKGDMLQMEDVLASPANERVSNLPSSPITVETPNRTTELLNNTIDISPINSKSSSDDGDTPEDAPVSCNLKAELEELEKIEKEKREFLPKKTTENEGSNNNEEVKEKLDVMEVLNRNEDLPSTIEDIISILEGDGDIPKDTEKQQLGEVPHEPEVMQEVAKVVHDIEELPHQIEEVPLEGEDVLYQTEEVTPEVEEVPHKLEEVPPHIEEIQHKTETTVEGQEDIPDQIGVIKPLKENNGIQERAHKLLNMINITSPATHKIFIKKRSGGLSMSPSSGRIKRLMSGINQKQNTDDLMGEVKEEDILTFSREVPSPLAVPKSSILKRKLSDTSDLEGASPCAKRKRVNFSDPCLTSKKVFIKDDYRDHFSLEAKCLFPTTPEAKTKEHKDILDLLDSPSSSEMTETENIETEPSLEVTNPLILRKDRPIYPKLVDCKEDVMVILKRVTSPMFINVMMNKLKNKDIGTIGDLARQSEAEINRFPFKVPVVANVYRALDNYYKKNVDKGGKDGAENGEIKFNGLGEEEGRKRDTPKRTSPVKVDIRSEFKDIIERSKIEGITEDLTKILLTSLEKQQLLTLVKSRNDIEPKDFLEQKDFKLVIRYIMETIGLPSIFEILTESVESSENESVYFDCMIKHSINKRPLIDLLETRSLHDIRTGLEEGISRNMFNKNDVLDTCLIPLIESPSDISSYLHRISAVHLGDIIIRRMEFSDIKQFFSQIIEIHSSKNVITSLNSELYKYFSSTTEIVESFKNCIDAQSVERQNEVMVEMFKIISSRLDLNTLLELHVNFLKRIPNIVAKK